MKLIILMFLGITLFNNNLDFVEFDSQKDAFVIVIDGIYCSACLKSLVELKHLWHEEYSTIAAVSSIKDRGSARSISFHLKKLKGLDSIIFIEKNNINDSLFINGDFVEFMKSPFVLVFKDGITRKIGYDELFSRGTDTNQVKRVLINNLK